MKTKHFDIRSRERFGHKFKKKQIKGILNQIRKGRLKDIGKQEDNSKHIYSIKLDGKICTVVYDHADDKLITIYIHHDDRKSKIYDYNGYDL